MINWKASSPVLDGLILHLDAANPKSYRTAGTIGDMSGFGKNATFLGVVNKLDDNGGVLNLSGFDPNGSSGLTLGQADTSIFPIPTFSIEIWFKTSNYILNTSTHMGLFSITYGLTAYISGGDIVYNITGSSSTTIFTSGINAYDGNWHHVVCTSNNNTMSMTVDGLQTVTGSIDWRGTTVWGTNGANIGRNNNNSFQLFSGQIGNFKIYNRVLTNNEIVQNYNSLKNRYLTAKPHVFALTGSNLVLNLDAGLQSSLLMNQQLGLGMSGTGSIWTDISLSNGKATMSSTGVTFSNNKLTLDGVTGDVIFNAPNLGTVATVEMWCKIKAGYSDKMMYGFNFYDIYCQGGSIGFNTGNSDCYGIPSSQVTNLNLVNNWAHYIFEMRSDVAATNNKIYMNGISQTMSQIYGTPNIYGFNGGTGKIGNWINGGYHMPMDISIFRVYNKSLTQAEVTNNFNAIRNRFNL